MVKEREALFSSNQLFPKHFSDQMINVLLSGDRLSWNKITGFLDILVSHLVEFGYDNIQGIRQRMDAKGITPEHITDFRKYETLFPMITISEMVEIGEEKFQLRNKEKSLISRQSDFGVVAKQVFAEGQKKDRHAIIADVTVADARAACLAIAGHVLREWKSPSTVLVNQKSGDYMGHHFLANMVVPALDLAGIPSRKLTSSAISTGKKSGLLLPSQRSREIKQVEASMFGLIISTDSQNYPVKTIHLGDYSTLFPNMGYRMPLPLLIRPVDSSGGICTTSSGNPDFNLRGRLILDRLFSAYEYQTPWKLLVDGLAQLLDYGEFAGLDSIRLGEIETFWSPERDYKFKNEFIQVLEEAGCSVESYEEFPIDDLHRIYSLALKKYFLNSVRLGVPSSTWLLKVGLPQAAQVDIRGVMNAPIELSLGTSEAFVPSKNLRIKYPREETLFISKNIIGKVTEQKIIFPEKISAAICKRVKDVLNGRNMFGPDTEGYLYTVPIVSPGEFDAMLNFARLISQPQPSAPSPQFQFEDVVEILARLHARTELELERALNGHGSMITLFAQKIKLPIAEIMDMLQHAKEDYIENDGMGLKVLLNAAFIDPYIELDQLREKATTGLELLRRTQPYSPVFMVTPGNITLYDSFCLFSHLLMANLADQRQKRLTIYIRPSESDITFNFLVYHFYEIAKEMDPDNWKGLRTLFQRAYWDPRYDSDFLQKAMANAEAGIYYGTAKTYMKARFKAAVDVTKREGFQESELERLLKIARQRKFQYHVSALGAAMFDGISPGLVKRVRDFIALHNIYPETLNGIVILPDAHQLDLDECAASILSQVISTRGADCTNANKLWIHRGIYETFMQHFEDHAGQLTVGNELNPATKLALYDTNYLKGTVGIISGREDTRIIAPTIMNTGERAPEPISPRKNYTGVLLTEIDVGDLIGGDPIDRDTYLNHLSKETPLPWLTIVVYDEIEQALSSMKGVLEKYAKRSGYPKYLYIALIGCEMVSEFEARVRQMELTDLIKIGDEAFQQFLYYRPHQGSFFINELVHST